MLSLRINLNVKVNPASNDVVIPVTYPDSPGFVRGSDTSEAAANDVKSVAGAMRTRILEWISDRGFPGATCDEVEVALSMKHQTASARISELSSSGMLADSGHRKPTRSGSFAVMWRVPNVR